MVYLVKAEAVHDVPGHVEDGTISRDDQEEPLQGLGEGGNWLYYAYVTRVVAYVGK